MPLTYTWFSYKGNYLPKIRFLKLSSKWISFLHNDEKVLSLRLCIRTFNRTVKLRKSKLDSGEKYTQVRHLWIFLEQSERVGSYAILYLLWKYLFIYCIKKNNRILVSEAHKSSWNPLPPDGFNVCSQSHLTKKWE